MPCVNPVFLSVLLVGSIQGLRHSEVLNRWPFRGTQPMQPKLHTPLVNYHYDALNRLVASTPSAQATAQRFYQKNQLITEVQGAVKRSIMQSDGQPLAQQQRQGSAAVEASLLATDLQGSVLKVLDAIQSHPLAYTPYGHRPLGNGLLSLLGFNAERPDPVTGCYLLGTGHHRPFNPVLGRFICPDNRSPFGAGGLNAYAYCLGDPVNRSDPNGHWSISGIMHSVWKSLASLGRHAASRVMGTGNVPATGVNRVARVASIDEIGSISGRQPISMPAPINTSAPLRRSSEVSLSDSFEFKGLDVVGPERHRAVVRPNLGPEDWADLNLVFSNAPSDATTSELMRVLDEMRNVRTGRTTLQNSTTFLEQFIGH